MIRQLNIGGGKYKKSRSRIDRYPVFLADTADARKSHPQRAKVQTGLDRELPKKADLVWMISGQNLEHGSLQPELKA